MLLDAPIAWPTGQTAYQRAVETLVSRLGPADVSVAAAEVPPVFAPLQQAARYKGIHGGRGSGKSHYFAERVVDRLVRAPRTRVVCIREVQKSLDQSAKRLLEDKILTRGVSARFRVLRTHIETIEGGIVLFQGMQNHTADSIKSLEGYDIAWVEEAQSLSQRSLDLLRPTIRKTDSELWFSWNPRHATDPVDALLRGETLPPGAVVVQANYDDNPWFPDVLRAEMEWDRGRDTEKYAHVWLGDYERHSEARVFKNWRIEAFDPLVTDAWLLGGDFGFAQDPTVLVRCALIGRTLYVDYEVYRVGCEVDHTPDLFDALVPEAPGWARQWPITADSARPETISYLRRHGYSRIGASVKGAGSVEEGVAFLQSVDIIVHPRCVHTIDELTHYRYKTDPRTGVVLPVLVDSQNHCLDALRYALERVRRATGPRVAAMWVEGI